MNCAQAETAKAEGFVVSDRMALLKCLDLTIPELARLKAALERDDVEAAAAAYIAHFRAKEIRSPAVTYTGHMKLPAVIAVALVPLAADQDLADLPQIRSELAAGLTTWTLPIDNGTLRFATSVEKYELVVPAN